MILISFEFIVLIMMLIGIGIDDVMLCIDLLVSMMFDVKKLMYIMVVIIVMSSVFYELNCVWFWIICGMFICGFCVECSVISMLLIVWLMMIVMMFYIRFRWNICMLSVLVMIGSGVMLLLN